MKCPLCGYEFDPTRLVCHGSCPMADRCAIICCPHCGYQVVDESKSRLAGLIQQAWHRVFHRGPYPEGLIPLRDLPPGQTARVARLGSRDPARLWKLSAYGLVPGSVVRLQQRTPAYVVWIGETQVSLDEEVAREIWLEAPS
jgi:Fe2+ transport system protein FeoA